MWWLTGEGGVRAVQAMSAEVATVEVAPAAGAVWPVGLRVLFRVGFLYMVQVALGSNHATVFEKIPGAGRLVQAALNLPYLRASAWLAVHVWHLTGAAAVPHASGFGDRALDWITAGLMLVVALAGGAVWSVLDRRRLAYPQSWRGLRMLLRLTLALAMFWYGAIKLWPVQMGTPSLATLHEPVGQLSPMTLLWTLLGSNPGYERVCGLAETVCGLLLVFRRTALSGALLAVVIMANVVLFDVFFDVPVRLYAANLLLLAVVIAAPDLQALGTLLFTRRPAVVESAWVPSVRGRWGRGALVAAEVYVFCVLLRGVMVHPQADREAAMAEAPAEVSGQWHLVASALPGGAARPFRTAEGSPMTDVFLEPSGRTTVRAEDGTLHGGGMYDPRAGTVTLAAELLVLVPYRMERVAEDKLVLEPQRAGEPVLELVRVPLVRTYPLFQRRFSLTSEFGYEH